MTHDYMLLAALYVLEGKMIGWFMKRHHHQKRVCFLNAIDKSVKSKRFVPGTWKTIPPINTTVIA